MSNCTSNLNCKYQDPGYLSPGYIDVIYIPDDNARDSAVRNDSSRLSTKENELSHEFRSVDSATPGYSLHQYDPERWISLYEGAALNKQNVPTRKRKHDDRDTKCRFRHQCTWDTFEYYLQRSLPVKIDNVSSFRDPTRIHNHVGAYDDGVLPCLLESLPGGVLDTNVTVQCTFPDKVASGSKSIGSSPRELDRDISCCIKLYQR
jgi:hypothetical protein